MLCFKPKDPAVAVPTRLCTHSTDPSSIPSDPGAQILPASDSQGKMLAINVGKRLLVGTTRNNYETVDQYSVRICCCRASSYWITVATGAVWALILVLIAICNMNSLLPFVQFAPWTVAACIVQALLMGVAFKQPMLFLPFRVACGILRTLSLVGIIYPSVGILCYTVYTFILDLRSLSEPDHQSAASDTHIRDSFLLILACAVIYAALGVITTAATKCAAQMRDQQKKSTAAASSSA